MTWWIALLGGLVAGQLFTGCFSAMQATGEAWSGDAGKEAHRDAMIADIVTLPVQAPLIAGIGVLAVMDKASGELSEKDRAKYAQLKAQVRADPEIVIRERWDVSKDEKRRTTIRTSLSDPLTPYTADQLEKIYATVPSLRWSIFEHPACWPEFLASHFSEAKEIYSKNSSLLTTMVSNPSMPIDLVEEISESGYVYGNAREKSKIALSRRLPDKDRDRLPDKWEIKEGTDPNVPDASKDTDHDGLDNWHEYLLGLHPTNPDFDGDGLPDGFEVENSLGPLTSLHESDAVPVPTALRLERRQSDGSWMLRCSIALPEQKSAEVQYVIYRDGVVIQRPRGYASFAGLDLQAPTSGEFVFRIRAVLRGEFSRLSVPLKIRADTAGGRWLVSVE